LLIPLQTQKEVLPLVASDAHREQDIGKFYINLHQRIETEKALVEALTLKQYDIPQKKC
jgi:hypothetical protein